MQWYAYLLIVLAVLILAGATLLAPRLRRRPPVPPVPAPERVPEAAPQEPVTEAPPVVELERPAPTPRRPVPPRARLSPSQSVARRGPLAALPPDRLDDQAWEEVRDGRTTAAPWVGAEVVRGKEGGDPAAVAFDAVRRGAEAGVDTVLIDTAGRLQNKVGLMGELGKVKRVVEKQGPIDETLLILDATTGQNGLEQARVFTEVCDVTGVVLTKLDGTAKGGIVIAVQRRLGIPVKLVGLGEGSDDLAPVDPGQFVDPV